MEDKIGVRKIDGKECDAISYLEGFQDGKQAGIKEVVDWINSIEVAHDVLGAVRFYASRKEYKAKLKSWGIDEKETR